MKARAFIVMGLVSVFLAACSGGGSDDGPPPPASPSKTATAVHSALLVATSAEAAGTNCSAGGVKISSGTDSNGDGLLEAGEASSIQYVCNGVAASDGSAGLNSIAKTLALSAGDGHCPAGGNQIQLGLDANRNGLLDPAEVTSTAYVCDGTTGITGATGATGTAGTAGATGAAGANGGQGVAGSNSVIHIASLPTGDSHCANGGEVVTAGPDDGSGQIASVTSTAYVCSGAPGADVSWVDVPGPSQQAQSNTGYLADNAAAPVTILLPAAPAVGDIVRVSGVAAGGWQIAQNAGQSIRTDSLPGRISQPQMTWTRQTGAGTHQWQTIASSADGSHLAALANDGGGLLYTSSDFGAHWVQQPGAGSMFWTSIASSADGSRLAATGSSGIFTSADFGVTWVQRTAIGPGQWMAVASSADGTHLAAVDNNLGYIATSTDAGATWNLQTSAGQNFWLAIASSADGSHLAATVNSTTEYVHTSADFGATWTQQAGSGQGWWSSVAMSADGSRVATVDHNTGYVSTSADAGVTWVQQTGSGQRAWSAVTTSADGLRLAAAEGNGGFVFTSSDIGVTWTQQAGVGQGSWQALASSADGSRIAAGDANNGFISLGLAQYATTSGTAGSIGGAQFDAIELQYFGGGVFVVLGYTSASGAFTVN
jgi:hypothetical protein